MKKLTLNQTIEIEQTEQNIYNLWYDWFCTDKALFNKGVSLLKKLKQIIKSSKLDPDNQYVFFKNNCPVNGRLYDDFRICDIKSNEVIYTITPKSGHKCMQYKGSVWGKENNFEKPLYEGSWVEIKKWFNS